MHSTNLDEIGSLLYEHGISETNILFIVTRFMVSIAIGRIWICFVLEFCCSLCLVSEGLFEYTITARYSF